MKPILTILLLLTTLFTYSQTSKFSFEASYPIPVDQNFIGKYYHGIIEIGAKYKFYRKDVFNFGASFNGGILERRENSRFDDFKVTAYTLQPRVFVELDNKKYSKIHPAFGLGYTFISFNASGTSGGFTADTAQTQSGINVNLGLSYDITKRVFIQVQYDYIKLSDTKEAPHINFNTSINLLKVGFGINI